MKRLSAISPSILAALALAAASAHAGDIPADCKPVIDAVSKIDSTPSHAYNTTTRTGTTKKSEVIHTAKSAYVFVDGKWTSVPTSPGEAVKQIQENLKNAKSVSCRLVKNESIDGQSTALYETLVGDGADSSTNLMWISKASGLPVHQKILINPNGPDKVEYEIRFEYTNVQAPAVK
jgi:hypothetical protein